MRQNLPVTEVETRVREGQYLISKTNRKGIITYANPAFIEISGFSREELIGQPHNLVRHPDMPPEAFKDLWETLQEGKTWLGVVKNRRKDGGYYWVLANAVPIMENGELTGYASVRVRPSEEQVSQAQGFYRDVQARRQGSWEIRHGQRAPSGWRRWLQGLAAPFSPTLHASVLRIAVLCTALVAGASGLLAMPDLSVQQHQIAAGVLFACALATLFYGWRLSRRVSRPLESAAEVARQVASGNLRLDIDNAQRGEVKTLFFYLDLMRKSLMSIAADVQQGVEASLHSAQQLDTRNTELASRTEQQAASLQQTAASMEELTVTVRQNADHARLASELADAAMQTAQRGGTAVEELNGTMQEIQQSARQIGSIVAMIEGIAFQTNILALNAAVESARAGEAGRGFAVVAGEVRNLAQRSAQAAKEIKELIDESAQRMHAGADQTARAGDTMQEIVQAVQRVTSLVGEISTASADQSAGLEQISQAVSQMEGATQRNAELTQDLRATVNTLSDEAQNLRHAIGVLNTGHTTAVDALPVKKRSARAILASEDVEEDDHAETLALPPVRQARNPRRPALAAVKPASRRPALVYSS